MGRSHEACDREIPGNDFSFMIRTQLHDIMGLYARSKMRHPYLQNPGPYIGITLRLAHQILGFLIPRPQTPGLLLRLKLLVAWGTDIV